MNVHPSIVDVLEQMTKDVDRALPFALKHRAKVETILRVAMPETAQALDEALENGPALAQAAAREASRRVLEERAENDGELAARLRIMLGDLLKK